MRPLYIAGPMTGQKGWGYPVFNEAAEYLRSLDFEVINPAENFDGDTTLPWLTYLRLAVKQVADSDGVVCLPGWKDSPGAQLEVTVATGLGLDVYKIEEFYNDDI